MDSSRLEEDAEEDEDIIEEEDDLTDTDEAGAMAGGGGGAIAGGGGGAIAGGGGGAIAGGGGAGLLSSPEWKCDRTEAERQAKQNFISSNMKLRRNYRGLKSIWCKAGACSSSIGSELAELDTS